ncbi:carbohydrate ABC transporter permease [Rhizobium sp. BK176]|uniref:carbohydrate ABC transporter permease n=1 Tax=Rhizobium sp. BK176 TaxID=2587071 RepID=UPI00216885E6|nr:carbohydrate ABC transporter permease [Rhizobium sp. BK176]MCS4096201.1 ABC-type glycerol-3-phosphate transport system permease component [Rhizobium sp. BK176]
MTDRLPIWLRAINSIGLTTWLIIAAFPFVWMFLISFRAPVDAFSVPPKLLAPMSFHNFYTVWFVDHFWRYAINTSIVTIATVGVSLAVACPAGYALSRYSGRLGFWLLVSALIFRAMPHIVLLTAYRPAFFEMGIWSRYETLIVVLVAINQPFTIWMMRSFFVSIPKELDEAAMIDGCTRFQAFRLAIMPVMGPGLITAGLFAFLLAYNDFLISSQLMNGDMTTMTAALGNYMGQSKHLDKLMLGIAGAVSVVIPIIVLILVFQKNIVAGMTQGAVKG